MNTMTENNVREVQRTTNINFSPYYDMLPTLINQRGYEYLIEIGVFSAGHAKSILDKTNVKLVLGIDPYKEYAPGSIGMGTISTQEEFDIMCRLAVESLPKERFHLIRSTSDEAFEYITNEANYFDMLSQKFFGHRNETKFDLVFIDGLHEAIQLQKDLDNYSQLIRKGGIISGHDINHGTFPDLTPVIYNFAKQHGVEVVLGPFHAWWMEKNWE
jgi:hypothetical protein